MKIHWKILIALVAGVAVGGWFGWDLDADPWIGVRAEAGSSGALRLSEVESGGPAAKGRLTAGTELVDVVLRRGSERERVVPLSTPDDLQLALDDTAIGDLIWFHAAEGAEVQGVMVKMSPDSERARWIAPFAFFADIFLRLLKMLIVPIILTSIITGVAGVGSGRDLRRLGGKTFGYYILTSLLAACTGLLLVNLLKPGSGAPLGLSPTDKFEEVAGQSFWDVLRRMVPENVFSAVTDNGQMLQVIFFSLLFGYFILRTDEPHQSRMKGFFESAMEVMMKLASFVLMLIPYGVFCLLVKVVGETGFEVFKALGLYMVTVAGGLLIHAVITLPLVLRFLGKVNPLGWLKAMGPALMTAFSTSSSSMTLPVSMETVEHRGRVSNKTTSFVLPLGATINMDGTALYECAGVIFLAQYYADVSGFDLTLGKQVLVVMMALLASIGAAGIPSAGLVMMLTILGALGLPVEGAALLLAVDRPLDMLRTVVNVWSDSCGAAVVASSEGERPLVTEGVVVDTG
ncbi:MAG: hypothetical protein DHS20C15_01320 [Planctomycetota bacterium]|nr:MAG: hypothetical protein DHS20C15_01320 [Planctomycetota bacterium]